MREVVPADQLTILFTATRHHAEFLYTLLLKEGVDAACVFGSMDQVGPGWRSGGGQLGLRWIGGLRLQPISGATPQGHTTICERS